MEITVKDLRQTLSAPAAQKREVVVLDKTTDKKYRIFGFDGCEAGKLYIWVEPEPDASAPAVASAC